jgi:hypothetical protein
MKRILLLTLALFAFVSFSEAQKAFKKGMAVYVNSISNPDKTINFIIGVYPATYDETDNYSTLLMRVLNQSSEKLEWDDYKIIIQLKDGTTITNYKTKAESGQFACNYTIKGDGGFNDQQLCFEEKFKVSKIDKIWVKIGEKKFTLSYVKGK